MTDLLIADDHPLFCSGFANIVQVMRPRWSLTFAGTSAQARTLAAQMPLDLGIINVCLPGEGGFALVKTLASLLPALPQILISGRDEAAVLSRARTSGARGFLPKSMEPERMIEAIDAVLAGCTAFDPCPRTTMPTLTSRQAEILELLAAGHGNKEIRYRLGIAERTVRAHLTSLFQLLGVSGRMQASVRARELGLVV